MAKDRAVQRLNKVKNEMRNIPKNEQIAINEILSAAQKFNINGWRYSDEWILLSTLLHMRSPKT